MVRTLNLEGRRVGDADGNRLTRNELPLVVRGLRRKRGSVVLGVNDLQITREGIADEGTVFSAAGRRGVGITAAASHQGEDNDDGREESGKPLPSVAQ
jgi:hypothetical protein